MSLLNIAKGLFIGGVFFVCIFYVMDVAGTRANAQAQAEQAEAEQARAKAEDLRTVLEEAKRSTPEKSQSLERFRIVAWNTDTAYGAYILETETGKVFAVDGRNKPTLIGQAE